LRILLHHRRITAIVLALVLLICAVSCAIVTRAESAGDDLAAVAAENYYLWGVNSNDPDFGSMSAPTGSFAYDGNKGYYYYDLSGASGDYCFVVSKVTNSGTFAVKSPAVGNVAAGGDYYLSQGNYRGYACMHIWNPAGDDVRIWFSSASAGLNVVKYSGGDTPTEKPTEKPTAAPPSEKPTSTSPTTPTNPTEPSGSRVVYCENAAGWSTVYAYLWNSKEDENASWPGVKMTLIGNNIWRYILPKNYNSIIFSESGANKTADLTVPASGYVYNNKTMKWSIYDTSPLQVKSFSADLPSPQVTGVAIILSAEASGSGTVSYRFSVRNSSGATTFSRDYSVVNTAEWIPTTTGDYTVTYSFKDTAGNTNSRTASYHINEALSSSSPFIKRVTPISGTQIKSGSSCSVTATAGGGLTGTNLLFYKFTVRNSAGEIVNTPYYTRGSVYSFTPTTAGQYSVTVSVQASNNTLAERTYTYQSVGTVVNPTEPSAGFIKGDADTDGKVTILDATCIQRRLASLPTAAYHEKAADADTDGKVTILDATRIQRWLASLIDTL
jgi:hypothetical protein